MKKNLIKSLIILIFTLTLLIGCRQLKRQWPFTPDNYPINYKLDSCATRQQLKWSLFELFEIDYFHTYDRRNIDSLNWFIWETDSTYVVEFFPKHADYFMFTDVTVLKRNCKIIEYSWE